QPQTLTRKTLLKPPSLCNYPTPLSTSPNLQQSWFFIKTSKTFPHTNFHFQRWFFTDNSYLPSPEWIEPFNDPPDTASETPQNLKPSPWVHQISSLLLDGSMDMESGSDLFCNKFLIKLSPNFVSFVLKLLKGYGFVSHQTYFNPFKV
ncbi:hypothetical protein NC653_031667, partial [Populus alba x Populus x berolinensis]